MSADNVTPFPPSGQPPKPKRRKQPPIGLQFAEGDSDGPGTLYVYQGLRGVCNALDEIDERRDLDLYADLSAAAAVLIGILEERWLPR